MTYQKELIDLLIQKEQDWLQSIGSDDQMNHLLDETIIGVSSTGKFFNKSKMIDALKHEEVLPKKAIQFRTNTLSDNLILLSYICMGPPDEFYENEFTFQTSIWKNQSEEWRLVFHQGTPIC